jgi:hypothetical protein
MHKILIYNYLEIEDSFEKWLDTISVFNQLVQVLEYSNQNNGKIAYAKCLVVSNKDIN